MCLRHKRSESFEIEAAFAPLQAELTPWLLRAMALPPVAAEVCHTVHKTARIAPHSFLGTHSSRRQTVSKIVS